MDGVSGVDIKPLRDVVRDYELAVLAALDGNRLRAAEMMDISIRALRNHIAVYRKQGFDIPESCYRDGFREYNRRKTAVLQQRTAEEEAARQARIDEYYRKNPDIVRLR
jgi:hypothetical protein